MAYPQLVGYATRIPLRCTKVNVKWGILVTSKNFGISFIDKIHHKQIVDSQHCMHLNCYETCVTANMRRPVFGIFQMLNKEHENRADGSSGLPISAVS